MFKIEFELGLWNAWIFMSVFLIQMFVVMFAGKDILKRSHVPAEARQTKFEHKAGLLGNAFWFAAMGYSFFLPLWIGTAWFYSGLLLFFIGVIILVIGSINFIYTEPGKIITNGVYKFSRHPMYLATSLIYLGAGIASVSWIFLILTFLSIYFFYREALIEERYCLEVYGINYLEYITATPRWIGFPKLNK